MRIGPSLGTNGLLEFYMDPAFQYDERTYDEPPSTGNISYFLLCRIMSINPSKYNPMTKGVLYEFLLNSFYHQLSTRKVFKFNAMFIKKYFYKKA